MTERIRNGQSIFDDLEDETRWRENCIKLISLLDKSDLNQKIMIAEIKRNLGDFEGCLEIIREIDDADLNWLKDVFIGECEKGNRWVVRLDNHSNLGSRHFIFS